MTGCQTRRLRKLIRTLQRGAGTDRELKSCTIALKYTLSANMPRCHAEADLDSKHCHQDVEKQYGSTFREERRCQQKDEKHDADNTATNSETTTRSSGNCQSSKAKRKAKRKAVL